MTAYAFNPNLIKPFSIGVVVSRFNEAVTDKLLNSALGRLEALGFGDEHITLVKVAGAVEIPLACQQLAKHTKPKAIITLGAVIRGETSHYDYVCQQVSQGCQTVSLQYDLPVIFGILTTENGEQALARAGGSHSDKGIEAVDTAMEMAQLVNHFRSL